MSASKQEVITFKVDESLAEVIRQIPNRSDFIRRAILSSLENVCPLCQGSGILTPQQKRHWTEFSQHHSVAKCSECEAVVMTCDRQEAR
ncbi:MAG TPA: CopG family transcriptional regulator [Spirochaetia bacterium]|nr:CopG family transcriptional regulator [Spirochaetia bacterium]